MRHSRAIALALVAVVFSSVSCGGNGGSGQSFSAASRDPLTPEARMYGLGPQPDPHVAFQPDVVIVSGAGRSIRSVEDGGLTWTIDRTAAGADRLERGKVMFVTGRSVGRVVALSKQGDDLKVTVEPVTLTDVIRDGTFQQDDIKLEKPIEYPPIAGDWEAAAFGREPSTTGPTETSNPTSSTSTTAASARDSRGYSAQFASLKTRATATSASPAATPIFSGGIGVRWNYEGNGLTLNGTVKLTFGTPTAGFFIEIHEGRLVKASIVVRGEFGTSVDFEGGIDGASLNRRVPFAVPGELTFPIAQVLGVPLTLTISQSLTVTSAFGAKVGTITGHGSFSLASSLGYGYADGSFGSQISAKVKREVSLINNLKGVPVGVMGLLISHRVHFNVGFGAVVLKAGVYMDVDTQFGVTRGSALGAVGTLGTPFVECQGASLGMFATFGAGISILEPVVRLINDFLALFTVKPLPTVIGPRSKAMRVYQNQEVIPKVQLCDDMARSTTGA